MLADCLTYVDGAAADIGIGIADGGGDLRQRDAVGFELVQIDFDLVLPGGAAPGIDLDDAGNRQHPALHDPVLDGAQIAQSEVRWADQLITVNLANQAGAKDLRRYIVRQTDILLEADLRLRKGEIVVDAIREGDTDEGQAVERGGAYVQTS
jgi:hypothetical protein